MTLYKHIYRLTENDPFHFFSKVVTRYVPTLESDKGCIRYFFPITSFSITHSIFSSLCQDAYIRCTRIGSVEPVIGEKSWFLTLSACYITLRHKVNCANQMGKVLGLDPYLMITVKIRLLDIKHTYRIRRKERKKLEHNVTHNPPNKRKGSFMR